MIKLHLVLIISVICFATGASDKVTVTTDDKNVESKKTGDNSSSGEIYIGKLVDDSDESFI